MGVCNLLCGIAVGISGANAAVADAADSSLFVKVLVVEVRCPLHSLRSARQRRAHRSSPAFLACSV